MLERCDAFRVDYCDFFFVNEQGSDLTFSEQYDDVSLRPSRESMWNLIVLK